MLNLLSVFHLAVQPQREAIHVMKVRAVDNCRGGPSQSRPFYLSVIFMTLLQDLFPNECCKGSLDADEASLPRVLHYSQAHSRCKKLTVNPLTLLVNVERIEYSVTLSRVRPPEFIGLREIRVFIYYLFHLLTLMM